MRGTVRGCNDLATRFRWAFSARSPVLGPQCSVPLGRVGPLQCNSDAPHWRARAGCMLLRTGARPRAGGCRSAPNPLTRGAAGGWLRASSCCWLVLLAHAAGSCCWLVLVMLRASGLHRRPTAAPILVSKLPVTTNTRPGQARSRMVTACSVGNVWPECDMARTMVWSMRAVMRQKEKPVAATVPRALPSTPITCRRQGSFDQMRPYAITCAIICDPMRSYAFLTIIHDRGATAQVVLALAAPTHASSHERHAKSHGCARAQMDRAAAWRSNNCLSGGVPPSLVGTGATLCATKGRREDLVFPKPAKGTTQGRLAAASLSSDPHDPQGPVCWCRQQACPRALLALIAVTRRCGSVFCRSLANCSATHRLLSVPVTCGGPRTQSRHVYASAACAPTCAHLPRQVVPGA